MIDSKDYDQIASAIHSDTSPVGIDAKKTHIYILQMLRETLDRLDDLSSRMEKIEAQLNSNYE